MIYISRNRIMKEKKEYTSITDRTNGETWSKEREEYMEKRVYLSSRATARKTGSACNTHFFVIALSLLPTDFCFVIPYTSGDLRRTHTIKPDFVYWDWIQQHAVSQIMKYKKLYQTKEHFVVHHGNENLLLWFV